MRIANLNAREKVLLVAEIGNNHEGDIARAERLVDAAADCGVDAVKFQTFRVQDFVRARDRERFARLARFELSWDQFERLAKRARSRGLAFLSTPLDLPSAAFLAPLVDAFKIASGDNNFYPLLERVSESGKPVIVSGGLTGWAELTAVRQFIENIWKRKGVSPGLAVLHCVSSYPAPDEETNLAVIPALARRLECIAGYSDHTLGIDACLAAAALGARIIEKHFTLDKNQSGFRDHQLSADPAEMRELLRRLRRIEKMLGSPDKAVQPSEEANQRLLRRAIVAARDLEAGRRLSLEDITWLRPADGLPPGKETLLLGRRLVRNLAQGDPITALEVA